MDNETKSMTSLILGIVVVAVMLVVGIYIQSSLETTFDADGTAGAAVNESLARPTTAGITLTTGANLRNGQCGTLTAVYNTTGNYLIEAGNYSQSGCIVTNLTSDDTLGATWLYNYPYTYSANTNASIAAYDSTVALSSGTPWLTIIVVVGFAVIILGFLTSGFGNVGRSPGAVY